MSTGDRPKLKLSFSKTKAPEQDSPISPALSSALRTPTIKLHVKPSSAAQNTKVPEFSQSKKLKKKHGQASRATPGSSGKKRKQRDDDDSDDELARKPVQLRKLTLTTKPPTAQSPITPTLKLKYKGRIPKRPLGLGYDSELDEREADPTILETFILRMPSGPDCDYLRDAVEHGTIGVARSQGGADVQMKFLERSGRRGIVTIRGQKWAATLVDLPCIAEGMKSWDKKGWVKSADICQILLVLGQVRDEDQARDFPLPNDVNPQTWQYAHGLTPPMRWIRKRRFARTNRTSVNAIEAVERKVNQLLAEDELAAHTRFELLDHDPAARATSDDSSAESDNQGGQGYYDDEDAEGDEVVEGDYSGLEHGLTGSVTVGTPTIVESQPTQEDQDADDDFILSGLLETADQPSAPDTVQAHVSTELPLPSADSSSLALVSTSPSAATETMAHTPAADDDDDDESDDDDEEEEEDEDDDQADDSMDDQDLELRAQRQKALDEIVELKEEVKKQTSLLRSQANPILARKIRARIDQIQGDLETARKTAGVEGDGEDGD